MTLFELLMVIFVIGVPLGIGMNAAKAGGILIGIGTWILSMLVCLAAVAIFQIVLQRSSRRRRRKLRTKYPGVYRVLVVPDDKTCIRKPEGAAIRVGDYGWEAVPFRKDELIYLQGLTEDWLVVWYAGFGLEQVEYVGPKSRSQYDWSDEWPKIPCPFPVSRRETTAMGPPI